MKTITIVIFWIILSQPVSGQEQNPDSTDFEINLDRFIIRELATLSQDEQMTAFESKYGTSLNSLGKCLVVFSRANLDQGELARLTIRVEEIATRFFDEGTPIYLSIGGMNSGEWTKEMNRKGFKENLTFISLGNYCVVEKGESQFENIFNNKTLELLGIKSVE